jgi:hypothetical protein
MIVVLVSTLQYVLSKYTDSLAKVSVLEEANSDPNTRVVTSQQALQIVNSLKGDTSKSKEDIKAKFNKISLQAQEKAKKQL